MTGAISSALWCECLCWGGGGLVWEWLLVCTNLCKVIYHASRKHCPLLLNCRYWMKEKQQTDKPLHSSEGNLWRLTCDWVPNPESALGLHSSLRTKWTRTLLVLPVGVRCTLSYLLLSIVCLIISYSSSLSVSHHSNDTWAVFKNPNTTPDTLIPQQYPPLRMAHPWNNI